MLNNFFGKIDLVQNVVAKSNEIILKILISLDLVRINYQTLNDYFENVVYCDVRFY